MRNGIAIVDDRHWEQTHGQAHRQIYTVILYLSNAMHCIGQTVRRKRNPWARENQKQPKIRQASPVVGCGSLQWKRSMENVVSLEWKK